MAKDPSSADRLTQVLFDAAEAIRLAAVLLQPMMPASSVEMLRRVGAAGSELNFERDGRWRNEGERVLLQEGPLWPRKETTVSSDNETKPSAVPPVAAGAPALVPSAPQASPDPTAAGAHPVAPPQPSAPVQCAPSGQGAADERIGIEQFMKVELRVAKVLAAERVEKSKKLLKLSVDVGTEHRTLVAGIAEAYEPDALVGKSVVIVFNLKPATLMGIESNGMVLAASPDGGKPTVVSFDNPPAPGTRVR
jgi:methionyl-tRNA synthetase